MRTALIALAGLALISSPEAQTRPKLEALTEAYTARMSAALREASTSGRGFEPSLDLVEMRCRRERAAIVSAYGENAALQTDFAWGQKNVAE